MRPSRLRAAILCVAAGGVVAVQVVATTGGSAAGFKPGSLIGKWSGSWAPRPLRRLHQRLGLR